MESQSKLEERDPKTKVVLFSFGYFSYSKIGFLSGAESSDTIMYKNRVLPQTFVP